MAVLHGVGFETIDRIAPAFLYPNSLTTPVLPQQPLAPSAEQHELTSRVLLPQQQHLYALCTRARQAADQELRLQKPTKGGKPYPLGQCLEICQRVFGIFRVWLQATAPLPLSATEQQGLGCLREFLSRGGLLRMIWGDLRGQYFQNAMQLGSLYVDVANDTVFIGKPPVEILPFEHCGMVAIGDFFHFASIARRYWRGELYPNHLFPHLGPYFPWVSVVPGVGVQLEAGNDYMVAFTRQDGFRSAQQVLEHGAPPAALVSAVVPLFANTSLGFSAEGRTAALSCCHALRQSPPDEAQRDAAVRQFLQVNQCLVRISVNRGQRGTL